MATVFSPTERQRLARKTSDITRLSEQFQTAVKALTGEQAQAFSAYQTNVAKQMAPYESALQQYQNVSYPEYQRAVADYQAKLEQYEKDLADVKANPKTKRTEEYTVRVPRIAFLGRIAGYKTETRTREIEEDRPIPTFTERAPSAPAAPTAPKVTPFSTKPFEAKRAELEQGLQREVGERKAGRLQAVSRRMSRPMLGGA